MPRLRLVSQTPGRSFISYGEPHQRDDAPADNRDEEEAERESEAQAARIAKHLMRQFKETAVPKLCEDLDKAQHQLHIERKSIHVAYLCLCVTVVLLAAWIATAFL